MESEEGRREYLAFPTSKSPGGGQKGRKDLLKGNGRRIDYLLHGEEGLAPDWKAVSQTGQLGWCVWVGGLCHGCPGALPRTTSTVRCALDLTDASVPTGGGRVRFCHPAGRPDRPPPSGHATDGVFRRGGSLAQGAVGSVVLRALRGGPPHPGPPPFWTAVAPSARTGGPGKPRPVPTFWMPLPCTSVLLPRTGGGRPARGQAAQPVPFSFTTRFSTILQHNLVCKRWASIRTGFPYSLYLKLLQGSSFLVCCHVVSHARTLACLLSACHVPRR